MQTLDHILVLILAVVLPLHGIRTHRRITAQLAAGGEFSRVSEYLRIMATQWTLVAALLVLWIGAGREPAALGLHFNPTGRWWVALGLTGLATAAFVAQSLQLRKQPGQFEAIRRQLGDALIICPHTASEARVFTALSLTAGICEELLYRGFLIAYLSSYGGIWFAAVVSTLLFGVGHAYQGRSGVLQTGAIGAVMAGLYILSGSIWLPMALHAVVDLNGGYVARLAVEADGISNSTNA